MFLSVLQILSEPLYFFLNRVEINLYLKLDIKKDSAKNSFHEFEKEQGV